MDDQFLDALRHALNHLYDHEQLRASPLNAALATASQPGAGLQQVLLEAIEGLRPLSGEPAGSVKRRIYQVLQLRYDQQFAQKEVAVQLGLSVRQFRRLQQTALEELAQYLVEKWALAPATSPGAQAATDAQSTATLAESLRWLEALPRAETTTLDRALPEVLRLVGPLAERNRKRLVCASDVAGTLAIHPLVLRQAMLHVLNTAILHAAGEQVCVVIATASAQICVSVQANSLAYVACEPAPEAIDPGASRTGRADWTEAREEAGEQAGEEATTGGAGEPGAGEEAHRAREEELVRQMLGAYGADLRITAEAAGWRAELRCPAAVQQPLLIVDDHPDTVALFKRYAEGTHYRIVATHDPQMALPLAEQEQPFVVFLDVMMPGVDGWEVLTRLKGYPATAAIPVWICTVLDQSELALSLGADGFLRKPVTRAALLQVLQGPAVRAPAHP